MIFAKRLMENIVDVLNNAYQAFFGAATTALEANETSRGQKTLTTVAATEKFKQRWELFRVACDQAEEFVESLKLRLGSVAGSPGQRATTTGLQPITAVHLEQITKAVRLLVF